MWQQHLKNYAQSVIFNKKDVAAKKSSRKEARNEYK